MNMFRTFQYFGEKWEVCDGSEIVKIARVWPGFLRMVVMAASLKEQGTVPEVREELKMSTIGELRQGRHFLTRM